MLAFLIRRLLNAAGVMLTVAFFAFMIFRFVGDPVELMLNEQATRAQRDELRVRLGLDRSFPLQYASFVANAARGEFGISYRNQQDVIVLIAERLPATLELVLVATVLSLAIGIPLGVSSPVLHQPSCTTSPRPKAGSQPSVTENTRISRMPTAKLGNDTPSTEPNCSSCAPQELRAIAV